LVLVHQHDGKGLRAYDPLTGRLRWRRSVSLDPSSLFLDSCGRYICEGDGLGLLALEPTTGVPLWRTDRSFTWYPVGGASSEPPSEPWRVTDGSDGPRILTWHRATGGGLVLAAERPGSRGATVLVRASGWYSSAWCQSAGRYLACTGESGVGVWRLW
jgi:outer membrane protein assembly factor BamB